MQKKIIYTEKIYTYQIDFARHVSNIVYIQWMENGRLRLMEEMGLPIQEVAQNEGIVPILTDTAIKYKRPYLLGNIAHIELWLSELRNASAIMEFRFYNEKEELCATAQQKGLFMDHNTMRPKRLPENYRLAFEKYLIKPENS